MLEEALKNLEAIRTQAETLSLSDRQSILAALTDDPDHVFDLVKQGRAFELYVVLQEQPELLTRQDECDMTPLHHASIDPTGTLAAIMIEHPSEAIWLRDEFGRIPLDVAEEMQNNTLQQVIAPVTFPRLFAYPDIMHEATKMQKLSIERLLQEASAVQAKSGGAIRDKYQVSFEKDIEA